ncbi:hypothetical protein QTG54_009247 [Skeletonema marinoi]|uniref:Uncharacterized protein n=1 Tax=Skeletonema marinoi TaxID=267567 RepID=A0AAD8Y6A2_9STRA|nr:hypothetical protein QTG54_009247 [Skeletonema marinoi]
MGGDCASTTVKDYEPFMTQSQLRTVY